MSEIITNKLTGKTTAGDVDITSEGGSATMQLQQGLAKVWHNIKGTGTVATNDSFNVSSVNDMATGGYKSNFTNSMSNTDYAASGMGQNQTDISHTSIATGHLQIAQRTGGGSDFDGDNCMKLVMGDLA